MYLDPAQVAPYVVPLYTQVKSGYLGYARNLSIPLDSEYLVDGAVAYRVYRPVFDSAIDAPLSAATWSDPDHRLTYAYPGFTTVTWGGVKYPVDSPEATAAFATPGVAWKATYREMWSGDDYMTTTSFNAWAVVDYSPAE